MLNNIIAFYNHPIFILFGGITATITIVGIIVHFIFWLLGISPLLWRLGYGRWFKKISILADEEYYNHLKADLIDSGIFREKNISRISNQQLAKVKSSDLLLIHYQSFSEEEIIEILSYKRNETGMIVYFPNFSLDKGNSIPNNIKDKINNTSNTTVVNFRGRLLNDIITTLITTSYEKRGI